MKIKMSGKMIDERFRELSNYFLPCGKYKNERLDCVPLSYIDWLAGQDDKENNEFSQAVKKAREYISYDVILKGLEEETNYY